MSDEITITRKYVIYPIASDMKEWERKVIKYVSENYEKRIQLLEQKIKHSKIPKEEKENLRKELDNLKIKYDAFQADPAITQSEINTYTYGTVRTAMEEEARKKNYILSWIYSEMIGPASQFLVLGCHSHRTHTASAYPILLAGGGNQTCARYSNRIGAHCYRFRKIGRYSQPACYYQ